MCCYVYTFYSYVQNVLNNFLIFIEKSLSTLDTLSVQNTLKAECNSGKVLYRNNDNFIYIGIAFMEITQICDIFLAVLHKLHKY